MMLQRGFPEQEYQNRTNKVQALMQAADISALLMTTEAEVRYFTGFLTRFWESPTRPWFVIIPATGKPVAVIPSIGAPVMARTWIDDIRAWRSPDLIDDGVSLLADTLREIAQNGCIATPMGHETHLRMPLQDWQSLNAKLPSPIQSDTGIMRQMRMVKSELEIAKIQNACSIAGRAFDRVPEIAQSGTSFDQVFRDFQRLCLDEGADWVPYLSGAAHAGGYDDVISPATPTPLQGGDVLMLDSGAVWDGYFCDYDRNFSIGKPADFVADAHQKLIEVTGAAFEASKPGATAADLFHVMDKVLTGGAGGSDAGRYGHGLGMQLTEWPSLIPSDHTVLETGMVLTLEPSIETKDGLLMVHEENIVIRENGAEWLSPPAQKDISVL